MEGETSGQQGGGGAGGAAGAGPADARAQRELVLKSALTAFKKRYKLTKLDDESRLGGGRPTTGGKKSEIAGIVPPREFGRDVWEELAKGGKIRDVGGGFYAAV